MKKCPDCKEPLEESTQYYGNEGAILESPIYKCPKCKQIYGRSAVEEDEE